MSDTITEALDRFKVAVSAEDAQRLREQDDLRFQFPDQQWPDDVKATRGAQTVNGVPLPARPMLSIPKLDQPIQLILNQERAAHLGVNIHPLNEDAEEETAEVLQGLYRSIEVQSRATLARSWAFDRGVKCGRGCYRILTEYDPFGGHPSDQRILIKRILYQGSVYLDPFAQEPDWSDGEWAFIVEDMPWTKYKRRFPDSTLSEATTEDFTAIGAEHPEWIGGTDEASRTIRVAEYFRKVYTAKKIEGDGEWPGRDDRDVKVVWSIINATEQLTDPKEWPGAYIPIVPVIGREQQPVDGKRRWTGVIGPNKDAARLFNYAASGAVEMAALEPKAPFDIDPEEIEGFESWWAQANTRNWPYLPRHKFIGQKSFGPIERIQVEASRLGPSMLLLQQAGDFIHAGTGAFEPTLGQESPSQRSGKAVLALQQQHDQGTSNYLDNLAEISLTLESCIILDLIPKIYDRPERVVRILGLEDKPQLVMLNQPYTMSPTTKRPVAAINQPPGQPVAPDVKHYDLNKGRYGVTVSIGKSYQSRLQQGGEAIGQILQADPALVPIIGPIYFKFRDEPGMREIADVLKKMRDQQYPFLSDDAEQGAAQQMPKLQQENAMLKQAATEMHKALETKQVEQDGKFKITHLQETFETERNKENNETKLAVAELGAKVDRMMLFMEERSRLGIQQHETSMGAADAGHEELMAQMGHQQAMQQGDQAHGQALEQGAQGHAQALEQGDQAGAQQMAMQDAAAAQQPEAGA